MLLKLLILILIQNIKCACSDLSEQKCLLYSPPCEWNDALEQCEDENKGGFEEFENIVVDVNGETRTFLLYVPEISSTSLLPIMLYFHGGGGQADQSAINYKSFADKHEIILAYPQAQLDQNGCYCWNVLPYGADSNGVDDLEFFDVMLNYIQLKYSTNVNKIFASGYSLGASFMFTLLCSRSNVINSVGIISSGMWQSYFSDSLESCQNGPASNYPTGELEPSGLVHIVGEFDDYAPYLGNDFTLSVTEMMLFWAKIVGASSTPEETITDSYRLYTYNQKLDGFYTIKHYFEPGGSHAPPFFSKNVIEEYFLSILNDSLSGDVNNDGFVSIIDIILIVNIILDNSYNKIADYNNDSSVDVLDVLAIVGIILSK